MMQMTSQRGITTFSAELCDTEIILLKNDFFLVSLICCTVSLALLKG